MTLEEKILKLRQFGVVFIHGLPSGTWTCSLEITAQVEGVSTEVRATQHAGPAEAVDGCLQKLREMLDATAKMRLGTLS